MKSTRTKKRIIRIITYLLVTLLGLIMIYPLVWLAFAALKPSREVLNSASLFPSTFQWDNFIAGWHLVRPYSFGTFFLNTIKLVGGCVIGSLIISLFVGYAFARVNFKFKNFWLTVLFITIMLPSTATLVSRYVIFSKIGWLNSLKPFIVPAFLGVGNGGGFFIYLVVQFIRGIPKELDESAKIDGCSTFQIITRIILPLCKPALFSVAIFAFMWNWDDFQNQLIYLTRVDLYTVALALRATTDSAGADNWGAVMAMAFCAILPATVMFFTLQQYFVEGISTSGIKG